ncbi:hypothetical protein C2845_PM02G00230 [Panicum miliaceum]|uniref:Uncharacterized protein n=1 Tax=Panicum miliaceum TaxID=4540 RepID=A0A3L6S5K2_PANMI|nr:hypothetical protein C2845_PM02G00230 [Panicum miliaceum]
MAGRGWVVLALLGVVQLLRLPLAGDSSAAGLGGGGWAFRPLHAGDSDGEGSCRRLLSS